MGSQPCPSVNRLPKDPPGTQPPLISPRDKGPPTRGIGISSTYQWAGISPSHQEAYSKCPLPPRPKPTSATRGADIRSKRGYNSIICKKVTTPKTYKNEKTENYNSDEGERKNPRKTAKPLEILSLQEKDFRLLMLNMMQDTGNKLKAKMDNLQETLTKEIQDIKLKEEMQNTITEKTH